MIASLLRLRVFVARYKGRLTGGIAAFALARVFEALVPLMLMIGIDRLTAGDTDILWPVLGIVAVVCVRFITVSFARIAVRRAGLLVAFDLRQRLYAHLQLMGPKFFGRYTIGDMMTRAVADIGLIQRVISHGTILAVVLLFASLVGFAFMLSLNAQLTLLIFPPLPFVFFYAWKASRRMGLASRAVQQRLSELGGQVQENLSGIRTIQAMAQEDHEIARFAGTNQAYADAFRQQARINSVMSAVMPTLAAVCSITILGYGGHLVLTGELTVGEFTAFFLYVNMVVQPFRVRVHRQPVPARRRWRATRLFDIFDRGGGDRGRAGGRRTEPDRRQHLAAPPGLHVRGGRGTRAPGRPTGHSPGRVNHHHGPRGVGQDDAAQAARAHSRYAARHRVHRRHGRARLPPRANCAPRSPWCPRIPSCSANRSATTSPTDDPTRPLDLVWQGRGGRRLPGHGGGHARGHGDAGGRARDDALQAVRNSARPSPGASSGRRPC